jgi:hypothetical protein
MISEHPGGCAARVKIAVEWWVTIALVEAFNQCREICAGQLLKVLWRTLFRQSTVHADKEHLSLHGKQHTISATWLTSEGTLSILAWWCSVCCLSHVARSEQLRPHTSGGQPAAA